MNSLKNVKGLALGLIGILVLENVASRLIVGLTGTNVAASVAFHVAAGLIGIVACLALMAWTDAPLEVTSGAEDYEALLARFEVEAQEAVEKARAEGMAKLREDKALVVFTAYQRGYDAAVETLGAKIRAYPDPNRVPMTADEVEIALEDTKPTN